jgi:aromatic-amino-acid transaminase
MFKNVPTYVGDPILSLQQEFLRDRRTDCVNMSIGLYYDGNGQVPILQSVRMARAALDGTEPAPGYLPMGGDPSYCAAVQALLFGEGSSGVRAGRIATIQTIGGSGALKVGADFLHGLFPHSGVWVSDPTWDNHRAIFEGAGFKVGSYPYFESRLNRVDFDAMLAFLSTLPPASIVILHPCCHNPTGADLSTEQWDALIDVAVTRRLIPFMDMAYQGFGESIEEDCYAIRAMVSADLSFLVSHSFSKIFSLYSERCGSLSVVCATQQDVKPVLGQLQLVIRRNYSSPPAMGARVVAHILNDPERREGWLREVDRMRGRIQGMRIALHDAMIVQRDDQDLGFLLGQRGLFSYAPKLGAAAKALREQFGIYILDSGRLCVAGLTPANVERVAHAFSRLGA